MTHESKCRFCGAVVMLEVADGFKEFVDKPLEWWLDLAACNRCADYRELLRKWSKFVVDTCSNWNQLRFTESIDQRSKQEALARRNLEKSGKSLGHIIARHTRKPNYCVTPPAVQEFVESFLGQPWKAESMLRIFVNGAEKQ